MFTCRRIYTARHYKNGWNPSPRDDHLFPQLKRNLGSHKFNDDLDVAKVVTDTMVADVGRDSSVTVAIHYGLDGPGIESRWKPDFPHPSRPTLGPIQSPVQWVLGLFPGIKRPGRGVDHPTPSAEAFLACSRVNFTFYVYDSDTAVHGLTVRRKTKVRPKIREMLQCRAVGQQYQSI